MDLKKNLFYIFILLSFSFQAQKNITFEHITSEHGLSQNDINGITQDKNGFLWIATHDGLNKFDGYSFKTFLPNSENQNSIPSSLVQRVFSYDGFIWTISTSIGVSRLDTNTEEFLNFRYDENNKSGLITNHINYLFVDIDKQLWVGTQHGINLLDTNKLPENKSFKHFFINENDFNSKKNDVISIYQDSNEQMWIGTASGLYKAFRDTRGKMIIIEVSQAEHNLPPDVFVSQIIENQYGDLIISTRYGVFIKKHDSKKFRYMLEEPILKLSIDQNNNLWGGNFNGLHLYEYNNNSGKYTLKERYQNDIKNPNSLNRNGVRNLFVDQSNIIWIGTKGGGINKMNPQGNPFRTIKSNLKENSLSYNNIRSLYKDSNNNLWVGTEDGFLNVSTKENSYKSFKSFPIKNVFSLAEINHFGEKYMLIGSESNFLKRVRISKNKKYKNEDFETIKDSISSCFALTQTKDQNIWIGSYHRGIHRLTPIKNGDFTIKDFNQQNTNLSSSTVRSFLEDSKGNLWIGTNKGLNFLPKEDLGKENPKFQIFKNDRNNKESISHNYILDLEEAKDGSIWIGTLGGGINKFIPATSSKPAHFKNYTRKNGLPNNIIKAIKEDEEGNLWITSNKGLSKFNPITKTIRNYDINDGLQGNEFLEVSGFKCKDGQLLFGGINGFNAFYPKKINDNTIEAKPLLTNLLFSNKKIEVGIEYNKRILLKQTLNNTEKIVLKPNENSFAIEFTSSHTVAPRKNKFKFKLEGFDEQWIDTDAYDRFAKYTNLRSGDYTFRLKASNNDGLWNSEEKNLQITITPPFWKSVWGYLLYTIGIIATLWAFRRYTIVRTEEKHEFNVTQMEKKQSEELQQMKLEFFTNISHEFRTPLTLIKGPLDYLEKNEEELKSPDRFKQYDLMKKNADYLLRLVNQLLDFRRLDREKMKLNFIKLNIVDFIEETTGPFLFMANKKHIDFKVKSSNQNILIPIDPDALEKILNNLLFNAFKFTPENHSITVEIHTGSEFKNPQILNKSIDLSEYAVIQIKDTGKGIKPEKLEHIFERYYVEKKQNIQGAGIGLSFTKSLVELHEGFITVDSTIGKGTTFSVILPLKNKETTYGRAIELEEELEEERLSNLPPDLKSITNKLKTDLEKNQSDQKEENLPKLLLIEDNEDIRTFVKQGLDKEYQVLQASNGQEGLNMAFEEIPSLIVTDIMMPIMDGLEMSSKLKNDEKTSHIPIIMLTAKSSTDTEREALEIGIEDFIRKPFDLDVLILKIKNITEKRKSLRDKYKTTVSLEPSEVAVTSVDEKFLKKAMSIVEDNMMNTEFSVEMLVSEMGMSRSNLYLKLKEITGLSSSEFIRSVRLKRAVQLIKKSDMSVKEIMYMTGFNTASYFSKCFKKQYGMVPSEYVKTLKKEKENNSEFLNEKYM